MSPKQTDQAIFQELARRIDQLPVPFPETQSGVEIRLLEALFNEDEARLALELSGSAEPVQVIARRVDWMDEAEISRVLRRLAKRGAINSGAKRIGKRVVRTYGLAPLVVGMFEFQVDKLTPEYIRDFQEYLDEGFRSSIVGVKTSQLRTVPIRSEIAGERAVAQYNDIRGYVRDHPGPFAVINCVCRQSAEMMGKPCTRSSTHETCLVLGKVPTHGREIDHEELLGILDRAEREGHVLQPQNSRKPGFICCCCPDCCEILQNARKLPRPADAVSNAYLARVDADLCTGCRRCVKRCPMEAITVNDSIAAGKTALVDESRCIGCGLCATTCPEEAITLVKRRGRGTTPRSNTWMYVRMEYDRRGIAGVARLALKKVFGRKI